jgi:iron complex outermembrane recepter protein
MLLFLQLKKFLRAIKPLACSSVDEYTIFSVRGQFRQRYNDWTLTEYARIDNLFDEKYVGSVRVNDANSRFYEPALGRNWIMGVKASLNF